MVKINEEARAGGITMTPEELAQWLERTHNKYASDDDIEVCMSAWLLTARELQKKMINCIDSIKCIDRPTHDFSRGWNNALESLKSRFLPSTAPEKVSSLREASVATEDESSKVGSADRSASVATQKDYENLVVERLKRLPKDKKISIG